MAVSRPNAVLGHGIWLLTIITHGLSKGNASHGVDCYVDIMALNVEKLIAHPTTSPSEDDGLRSLARIVNRSGYIEKKTAKLFLLGSELDDSSRHKVFPSEYP
ncbi:hypothetical protein HG531_000393 [Fusarium graminearum]|nr:hypothetical protein HG531_000393 [Fusarium graminearum]